MGEDAALTGAAAVAPAVKPAILVLLALLLGCGSNPAGPASEEPPPIWSEDFTAPTGSLPDGWFRSEGEGAGQYWTADGWLRHTATGQCGYYCIDAGPFGDGVYEFDVYGTEGWEFAWRISGDTSGMCRRLVGRPYWHPFGGICLIGAGVWEGAGYPWQDSDWGGYRDAPYTEPSSLQHVVITDRNDWVEVRINGIVMLNVVIPPIPPGIIGVGCVGDDLGIAGGAPRFDNLIYREEQP